jgi:hypothetical protein
MNEQQISLNIRKIAVQTIVDMWKNGSIGYTTMVLALERLPADA